MVSSNYCFICTIWFYNFQDYPVIFMGGGSLLFKQFIEERYIINVYEIIDDPFSNAIAYKRLISKEK